MSAILHRMRGERNWGKELFDTLKWEKRDIDGLALGLKVGKLFDDARAAGKTAAQISNFCNYSPKNYLGVTPLWLVLLLHPMPGLVELLLENGADPNASPSIKEDLNAKRAPRIINYSGNVGALLDSWKNNLGVIDSIIVRDFIGLTPLFAISLGWLYMGYNEEAVINPIISSLFKYGAVAILPDQAVLTVSTNIDLLRVMRSFKPVLSEPGMSYAKKEVLKFIEFLIANRVPVNRGYEMLGETTPLSQAVYLNCEPLVKLLINHGARVDHIARQVYHRARRRTMLQDAVRHGNVYIALMLLTGTDPVLKLPHDEKVQVTIEFAQRLCIEKYLSKLADEVNSGIKGLIPDVVLDDNIAPFIGVPVKFENFFRLPPDAQVTISEIDARAKQFFKKLFIYGRLKTESEIRQLDVPESYKSAGMRLLQLTSSAPAKGPESKPGPGGPKTKS